MFDEFCSGLDLGHSRIVTGIGPVIIFYSVYIIMTYLIILFLYVKIFKCITQQSEILKNSTAKERKTPTKAIIKVVFLNLGNIIPAFFLSVFFWFKAI